MEATLHIFDQGAFLYHGWFSALKSGSHPVRVYGDEVSMYLRALAPSHCVFALDDRKSWRREQFPLYKADREKKPAEFFAYCDACAQVLAEAGMPAVHAEWYEADDCAATICATAPEGLRIVLVTRDQDWHQLLRADVEVYDLQSMTYLRPEDIETRWGVAPPFIPDAWALIGTENLPGAVDVGKTKTRTLLQRFGTVENLYAALDRLTEATGLGDEEIARRLCLRGIGKATVEALRTSRENVEAAYHVAKLSTAAPVRLRSGLGLAAAWARPDEFQIDAFELSAAIDRTAWRLQREIPFVVPELADPPNLLHIEDYFDRGEGDNFPPGFPASREPDPVLCAPLESQGSIPRIATNAVSAIPQGVLRLREVTEARRLLVEQAIATLAKERSILQACEKALWDAEAKAGLRPEVLHTQQTAETPR